VDYVDFCADFSYVAKFDSNDSSFSKIAEFRIRFSILLASRTIYIDDLGLLGSWGNCIYSINSRQGILPFPPFKVHT
jgi:hypothetical protein